MHVCVYAYGGREHTAQSSSLSERESCLSYLRNMVVQNRLHCSDLTSLMFVLVIHQKIYQLLLASWAVLSSAKRPREQSN